MAAREVTVRIQSGDRAVEVRANDEESVWIALVNPDGDGEVSVDRAVLEDALAFVVGAGPGEWLPDE